MYLSASISTIIISIVLFALGVSFYMIYFLYRKKYSNHKDANNS